jgi:hypothetical protein
MGGDDSVERKGTNILVAVDVNFKYFEERSQSDFGV